MGMLINNRFTEETMKCIDGMHFEMGLDRMVNFANVGFSTRERNIVSTSRKNRVKFVFNASR